MKKVIICAIGSLAIVGCNGTYNNQLELAKKEKCELLAKYEQLKTDSTNASLREDIHAVERMLDTHKELSENSEKFTEELKNYQCK